MQYIIGTSLRKFCCMAEMWVCYNNGTKLLVHDRPSAPKHIHDDTKKNIPASFSSNNFVTKQRKIAEQDFCLKGKQCKTEVEKVNSVPKL